MAENPDEVEAKTPAEKAAKWVARINQSVKVFRDYQDRGDKIDKLYADAHRLANTTRDREFQLFWANIQVMGPSIYARPPVPVVVPRFKDRKPVPRVASEMLERCTSVVFDSENIDIVMRAVRDDLAVQARGVSRVRLEDKWICIDPVDRHDFTHDPARNWKEVGWVAFRAWMTDDEFADRFSAKQALEATSSINKDAKEVGADNQVQKYPVWEIWSKTDKRVFWVSDGCEDILDDSAPMMDLSGFFPCPRPVYATLQRGSLVPVQDYVFYKDQLEEINILTKRIAAMSELLRLKAFIPGGGTNSDVLEAAMSNVDDNRMTVPIPDWNAFTNGQGGQAVIWMPIDQVAQAIQVAGAERRALIEDVYQITGMSDIMRGQTDPNETLGAQQLKAQAGSIRVRDKQNELIRHGKDIASIVAELLAEEFPKSELLEMSQMEIDTNADIAKERKPLEDRRKQIEDGLERAAKDPQIQAMAQQNPEQAQQMMQQAQQELAALNQQIDEFDERVTIEKIMDLFRDQKTRPFIMDIQTDSTIQADEMAEKAARAEVMNVLGGYMSQMVAFIQVMPEAAPFAGELLKFGMAPYRAGREIEQAIEDFVESIDQKAKQPQPNPEAEAAQAMAQAEQAKQAGEQQRLEAEMAMKQLDMQMRQQEFASKQAADQAKIEAETQQSTIDAQAKIAERQALMQERAEKHAQDMERGRLDITKIKLDIARLSMPTGEGEHGIDVDEASGEVVERPDPIMVMSAALTEQSQALSAALSQLAAAQLAPKAIVRDPMTGRPVGVQTVVN